MGQAQSDARLSREEENEMMDAITTGDTEGARAMMEANPSLIYVHSKDGLNVWHLAAQSGDPQVVNMVAAAVSEVLSHQKKQDRVLAQVNAGFNTVNLAVNHLAAATTAAIPSQIAIPMGRNIDKDAQTREGKTALMVAVQGGHTAAAAALLECDVDAWRADIRGNTALHMAAWKGDVGSVKLLLEHADKAEAPDLPDPRRLVNASNLTGLSPCHFAAWRGHGSALRELVNAGAALAASASADSMGDVSCNKGSTPLHLAAMKGDVAIIRLLLKAHSKLLELTSGADHRPRDPRRIPDGYGKTAYTIAFDLGRSEAAEVLDPTVALSEAINRASKGLPPKRHARKPGGGGALEAGGAKDALGRSGAASGTASPEPRIPRDSAGARAAAASPVPALPAPAPPARRLTDNAAGAAAPPPLAPPPRPAGAAAVPALAPPPKHKPAQPAAASAAAAALPVAPKAGAQEQPGRQLPAPKQQPVAAQPEPAQQQHEEQQQKGPEAEQEPKAQAASGSEEREAEAEEAEAAAPGEEQATAGSAGGAESTDTPACASEAEPAAAAEAEPASAAQAGAEAGAASPAAAAAAAREEPPEALVCPITGELFKEPLRACDGRCYEREAIEAWLMLGNTKFPGGRAAITSRKLSPDADAKRRADAWRAAH